MQRRGFLTQSLLLLSMTVAPVAAATPDTQNLPKAPDPIERGQLRYPDVALAHEMPGIVVVAFTITPQGLVTDAIALSEDPPGYDFATAAIEFAKSGRYAAGIAGRYKLTAKFCIIAGLLTKDLPEPPAAIRQTPPVYPAAALQARASGEATVDFQVDCWGKIAVTEASEEPSGFGFAESARAAVKSWQATAAEGGHYRVTFSFKPPEEGR